MEIKEVFYDRLEKATFTWPAESPIMVAGSFLKRQDIDLLRLTREGIVVDEVITGYAILSSLIPYFLYTDLSTLYDFFFQTCGTISEKFGSIDAALGLKELIKNFVETRRGYAGVRYNSSNNIITLHDVLELYVKSILQTDMLCKEVASPIHYVSRETSLFDLLGEMLSKSVRRLFINQTISFISDKVLISYLFSSDTIRLVKFDPKKLIEVRVFDIGPIDAMLFNDDTPVREAASALLKERRSCVVCKSGVVTPWDCVIKPFLASRLNLL